MKIRSGFVSNSSTSSFLIYGVYEPQLSIDKILVLEGLEDNWATWYKERQAEWGQEYPEMYPDITLRKWVAKAMNEEGDLAQLLNMLSRLTMLPEIECEIPYDEIYLGLDPRSIAGEETMNEFKQRVYDTLALFVDGEIECGWHEAAWRDG